jgi:hypothetical protein
MVLPARHDEPARPRRHAALSSASGAPQSGEVACGIHVVAELSIIAIALFGGKALSDRAFRLLSAA